QFSCFSLNQKSSGNGKFTCEDTEEQKKFILNNCHKNQISCSNLGIPPTAIIQFFPELESSVNDNCVGDGRDGVGLGFPETHRILRPGGNHLQGVELATHCWMFVRGVDDFQQFNTIFSYGN
uniref:Uncharacterized protein n=2 Tax=Brassica oleracea TaxID=3712 RepID=A0A0D3CFG1_BRAOL